MNKFIFKMNLKNEKNVKRRIVVRIQAGDNNG